MNDHQQLILMIQGLIYQLPEEQRRACEALVNDLFERVKAAGEPVGTLAVSLVGATLQLEASKGGVK